MSIKNAIQKRKRASNAPDHRPQYGREPKNIFLMPKLLCLCIWAALHK